jgi:UDP-glucose 4-epimerase
VALAAAGHTVVAASRGRAALPGAAECVAFDLLDADFPEALQRSAGRCDAIVHSAACMDPALDHADVSRANCSGTHLLLNVARAWGGVPFVFISGVGVLGAPVEHPVTESHPARPASAYTASKLYGEHLTRLYSESGARGITLRVSSPVGPGMRTRRIFSIFVEAAMRGETIRVSEPERQQDYVDVRDVAAAILACLASPVAGLFNVASARPVSNLDLARRAVAALKSPSDIDVTAHAAGRFPVWEVSIAAAAAALGFQPAVTIEESIRDFAAERAGAATRR